MLLHVRDLSIRYGQSEPTVHGIDFDLEPGEILSIVGESGSGKTTVIRSLLGVLPGKGRIAAGTVLFNGTDLRTLSPEGWRHLRGRDIAMIFQDSGSMLNPIRTIGSQFVEYIRAHSDDSEEAAHTRAADMLRRMNLPNPELTLRNYPFELSGGMRQRVGIAMALTFAPKLLLADEPTSALDVTTQAQIVKELIAIARERNTAMIMVTHNIGVAAYMSDHLLVMQNGLAVEYGPAETILKNPQQDYTQRLLAAVPELGGFRYV